MKNILIMILLTMSMCVRHTDSYKHIKIEMYEFYNPRGYTTASAYGTFTQLDERQTNKYLLDSLSTERISAILSRARIKRMKQSKTGLNLLFFRFTLQDGNPSHRVCLHQNNCFTDFDSKIVFWIDDEADRLWLKKLQQQYGLMQ